MKVRELIARLQEEDPEALALATDDRNPRMPAWKIYEVQGKHAGAAHSAVVMLFDPDTE